MLNCAIVGATGYTGSELIKLLLKHPGIRLVGLTTRQKQAIPVTELVPTLPPGTALEIEPYDFAHLRKSADLVFLCLPHTEAAETGAKFYKAGKIVIDLSADFRLRQAKDYEKWYGLKHKKKELLSEAVYGLPELYGEAVRTANLIANPGCYPTGTSLGLIPLLREKLIEMEGIISDAKSGVSGAGKKLNPATQFCAVDGNFYAYKVGTHQHTPEIAQTLADAAGREVGFTFTAHLLPVDRGILTTLYVRRKKGARDKNLQDALENYYAGKPFVRVKPAGRMPQLKDVVGTNYCDIGCWSDPHSDRAIIITAIDNLLKGASGQAVQNMNIRCGFPEEEGLKLW